MAAAAVLSWLANVTIRFGGTAIAAAGKERFGNGRPRILPRSGNEPGEPPCPRREHRRMRPSRRCEPA